MQGRFNFQALALPGVFVKLTTSMRCISGLNTAAEFVSATRYIYHQLYLLVMQMVHAW